MEMLVSSSSRSSSCFRALVSLKPDCSVKWFHLNLHRESVVKRKMRGSDEGHYRGSLGFQNP